MPDRFEVRPLVSSVAAATETPLYIVWDTVRDTRVTTVPAWITKRYAEEDAGVLNTLHGEVKTVERNEIFAKLKTAFENAVSHIVEHGEEVLQDEIRRSELTELVKLEASRRNG